MCSLRSEVFISTSHKVHNADQHDYIISDRYFTNTHHMLFKVPKTVVPHREHWRPQDQQQQYLLCDFTFKLPACPVVLLSSTLYNWSLPSCQASICPTGQRTRRKAARPHTPRLLRLRIAFPSTRRRCSPQHHQLSQRRLARHIRSFSLPTISSACLLGRAMTRGSHFFW